jgi:DNA-binding MltR family transcriptional regulator
MVQAMPSQDQHFESLIAKTLERLIPIFEEIEGSSDRSAAITAAAYFEEAIVRAIKKRFVPLSNTKRSDIFEGYGPLSTLSAKIDIAYALGIYKKNTRVDLQRARKIRNFFAHEADKRSFDNEPIAKLCLSLQRPSMKRETGGHSDHNSPRDCYLLTLKEIGYALSVNVNALPSEYIDLP